MEPKVHYRVHKSPLMAHLSRSPQRIHPIGRPCLTFCYRLSFYGEELIAPRPTPQVAGSRLVTSPWLFEFLLPSMSAGRLLNPQPEAA